MGRRQQRAHRASYCLLLAHLLKWQFQPSRRSRSWAVTIARERLNILERESESQGLQRMAGDYLGWAYAVACRVAAREAGLPLATFPAECPYTIEFLRDHDALPE